MLATREADHGRELYTHDLVNIAEENGIEFPGNPFSRDEPCIRAGRILGKLFRDAQAQEIEVDGYQITRINTPDYSPDGCGRTDKRYTVTKP